jgi:hypothetical protein
MEEASEQKLKSYHLEQDIIQMNIDQRKALANQAANYEDIIDEHKRAIQRGEDTFAFYREFMAFEG